MKENILRLLLFYQKHISVVLGSRCRFYPTCSEFTYEAIAKYGTIKGLLLGIKRILRCHPFFKSGYDPVK